VNRRSVLKALCLAPAASLWNVGRTGDAYAQNTVGGKFNMAAFEPSVPAPAFQLDDLEGNKRFIGPGQENKFVLLNFWATWCPPCVRELPSLQRLTTLLDADKFGVFAVSVDKEKHIYRILEFQQKLGLTFPIARDDKSKIAKVYGVREFPSTFLVDPGGQIVAAAKGERDWHTQPAIAYFKGFMKRYEQT